MIHQLVPEQVMSAMIKLETRLLRKVAPEGSRRSSFADMAHCVNDAVHSQGTPPRRKLLVSRSGRRSKGSSFSWTASYVSKPF